MPALTPQYLADFQTRMRLITEREYARFGQNLWWQRVAKQRTSNGLREYFYWLLSTAQIHDEGKGGNIRFDDLVTTYTNVENRVAGGGLKLSRFELEDNDAGGLQLANAWSADMGAYMAYWPQKRVADILKRGDDVAAYPAYDGKAFFATDHPLNPYNLPAGNYANLLTDPGYAIDDRVPIDQALDNLGALFGQIASIKMPNGEDPRYLRPSTLIVPPNLYPRAVQLTNARAIAQAAIGGAAATADIAAVIDALGFAQPIMADELGGYEEDHGTYYVVAEQMATSELGAIIYLEREPFHINYYGVLDDAELNRSDTLEWHCKGRNVAAPGHPYLLFKVQPPTGTLPLLLDAEGNRRKRRPIMGDPNQPQQPGKVPGQEPSQQPHQPGKEPREPGRQPQDPLRQPEKDPSIPGRGEPKHGR